MQDTLAWQDNLNVSAVVSPTVLVDAHTSRWAQIAMMLAQETISQHQANKPLLISLVIAEEALQETQLVDGWLNEITQMDVDGFYLVIRRLSEAYSQQSEPDILTSLLRVCYSLAEINEYKVFVGYSDMVALLLHAGWRNRNWCRMVFKLAAVRPAAIPTSYRGEPAKVQIHISTVAQFHIYHRLGRDLLLGMDRKRSFRH